MGEAEFKRVFKASPATRRSEWASVIIYSFLLFVTLGTGAFLIADQALDIDWRRMTSEWLLVAGAPLVFSLIVGCLWSRSRCRFVLVLEQAQVQAGPLCIKYEDVNQVSLYVGDITAQELSPTAVEIFGGGKRICVRLGNSERAKCAVLLRERCRNAIVVDEDGHVYLPTAPPNEVGVTEVALTRLRRMAMEAAYEVIAFGALFAGLLFLIMVGRWRNSTIWPFFIIAAEPFCLWLATMYFRKAIRLRKRSVSRKH